MAVSESKSSIPDVFPEQYKPGLVNDLCDAIRFPSRSCATGGEEGRIQRWVAQRMRSLGARVRTFEASHYPSFFQHPLCCGPDRNYQDRPTVIGELGPEDAPAFLIAAHSDTVEVFEPEKWTQDPFTSRVQNGNVYG